MMASAPMLTVDEETLEAIKSCYCNSVTSASDAISNEETDIALLKYFDAMKYIEQGIAYNIHDTRYSGTQWDEARDMQQHMIETLSHVRQQIYILQHADRELNLQERVESPPPYSENDPNHHRSENFGPHTNNLSSCLQTASPLLVIPSGVQMYFVSNHTDVNTTPPSYPTSLQVYQLDNLSSRVEQYPQAILQVGDEWIYPLSKNQMPVFYSANGAYVFPSCSTDGVQEGSAVGIVLSNRLDRRYVEMFESILENYAVFRREDANESFVDLTEFVEEPEQPVPQLSERLASGLVSGAEVFGQGLKKGTCYVTTSVESSSNKLQEHLTPSTVPMSMSPMLKSGLSCTHELSCNTLRLSKQLVCWLCSVTKQISESIKMNTGFFGEENTNGVLKVTGAGLVGLGKIWKELQKAGAVIAQAVTNATVKNVKYKYGNEAAETAGLAVGTAINVGTAAWTIDNLGLNTLAEITSERDESDSTQVLYERSSETVTIVVNTNY